MSQGEARRLGVFVCHCGLNIAGTIDVAGVVEALKADPGVALATDYKYLCSEPGQALIRAAIADERLDAVVVAACTPAMHEATFRRAASAAGLNPYRVEIANIREQVAWVHARQPEEATRKAIQVVRSIVEKARRDAELTPLRLPLLRRALVIGGGIAGLQAALDIADAGYPVTLVEREARLGGRMAQLSGTYFNLRSAGDLLAGRLAAVQSHPLITVLTETEVEAVSGSVGNFRLSLRRRGAGEAEELAAGAIVVATGFDLLPLERLPEYGGGRLPDVISALQFEEMLRPDGPTAGVIRRPSDGRQPRDVVFVQCAGSRDPEKGLPYCSKICCMVTAKQARLFQQRYPDGQAYVFYIDVRAGGKDAEEYVQDAMQRDRVLYLRGKVSRVFQEGDKTIVWGVDTLSGQVIEIPADLVILAAAVVARPDSVALAQRLHAATDQYGFFSEAHPKLRPVESLTAGVFLAGAAQGPKDIPESVAQAGAAAAKVLTLFSHSDLLQEPTIAEVDETRCAACQLCVPACPYQARQLHAWKPVVTVNAALCQGCGACVMVCPNKAAIVRNAAPAQTLAMLEALL
jgi:heterodisulfide reductase subunit A-like polyferredoxin